MSLRKGHQPQGPAKESCGGGATYQRLFIPREYGVRMGGIVSLTSSFRWVGQAFTIHSSIANSTLHRATYRACSSVIGAGACGAFAGSRS